MIGTIPQQKAEMGPLAPKHSTSTAELVLASYGWPRWMTLEAWPAARGATKVSRHALPKRALPKRDLNAGCYENVQVR